MQDPSVFNTPAGAVAMRVAAVSALQQALPQYIVNTGLLTDEIKICDSVPGVCDAGTGAAQFDARILPEGSSGYDVGDVDYGALQHARALMAQALGAIAAYDTGTTKRGDPVALRSELYALEGYTEILLADYFCSGVPLSTLDFQKDFTYRPSSSTAEVYQDALVKLDSAFRLAQASDSVRLRNLALVLKGRAWVALGQYDSAAVAVADVPNAFQYQLPIPWRHDGGSPIGGNSLSDREGRNGLPFVSSNDPRTRDSVTAIGGGANRQLSPTRYSMATAFTPFIVADGIEARLIQAEAALHAGNVSTWLTVLNALRTTGGTVLPTPDSLVDTLGVTGCTATTPCWSNGLRVYAISNSYQLVETRWDITYQNGVYVDLQAYTTCQTYSTYRPCQDSIPIQVYHAVPTYQAGIGGVNGLAPLTDPGTDSARVSLTFQERAYWLYLTGHRQSDLRRLIRNYGRDPEAVYPTGVYRVPGGTGFYGRDVTVPIPKQEYTNPLFHGCLSRGA